MTLHQRTIFSKKLKVSAMAQQFATATNTLVEVLSNLEKQYTQKYEEQQALINKLIAENDELRSYDRIDESLLQSLFSLDWCHQYTK